MNVVGLTGIWITHNEESEAMKIAVMIARVLLGIAFVFAGVMKFMPMKPGSIPPGDAGAMMTLMVAHKWMLLYGLIEAVSGLLLLAGRFVPLALTLLAGMLVNIMLFNATLFPGAVLPTLVLGALEIFMVWAYRESFAGVFSAKAAAKG
jgi:putative oxidoreductase